MVCQGFQGVVWMQCTSGSAVFALKSQVLLVQVLNPIFREAQGHKPFYMESQLGDN